MKSQKDLIILSMFIFFVINVKTIGQDKQNNDENLNVVSEAPVKYRVNEKDGITLHGYYSKDYKLTIYGNANVIGYRADCDIDDDWSGAVSHGTTQSSNSFESKYSCIFNPHQLFGTVLPGNKTGQNHYDGTRKFGVDVGDLTITYKIDSKGNIVDYVLGVVFDLGPHNQPGESSVATCKKLKALTDNNEYIYIIFPNSRKYLKQIIGTKLNSNKLSRNPTNDDFVKAFELMKAQEIEFKNNREVLEMKIKDFLSSQPIKKDFDNPNSLEKSEGRNKPKNNDRNSNI